MLSKLERTDLEAGKDRKLKLGGKSGKGDFVRDATVQQCDDAHVHCRSKEHEYNI